MKKILCVLFSILFIINSMFVITNAEEKEDIKNDDLVFTQEEEMPNCEDTEKFSQWISSTKRTLEDFYCQEIIVVSDDEDAVRFYFGERYSEPDVKIAPVDYIEYYKSKAQGQDRTSYSYKITYYFAWSTSWTQKSTKGPAVLSGICTAIMYLFPNSIAYTVANVLSKAMGITEAALNTYYNNFCKVRTLYTYYYRNMVVSIYNSVTSSYLPRTEIGLRRTFSKTMYAIGNTMSMPSEIEYNEYASYCNNYTPNPSESHKLEKKSYYDNTSWAINKAVEMHLANQVYCDVYGVATNIHYFIEGTTNG